MDKARLYSVLDEYKIRVPQTMILNKKYSQIEYNAIKKDLKLPVIIKPNDGGSSIGVTKIDDWEEFDKALEYAFQASEIAIIQEFITGNEITCPVINGLALPVGEIVVDKSNTFFDYEAKYNSNLTQEIFPANLPKAVLKKTQELAVTIHAIIGAKGLTRSDFIYNPDSEEIVFLEINTSPGMTSASLCPKSAKAQGWDFDELVKQIIGQ
jgi:D-alanine-D-alanine ligase